MVILKMPYKILKNGNMFAVVNSVTGKVHSYGTTLAKAQHQINLMNAVDHGWKPKKKTHHKNSKH